MTICCINFHPCKSITKQSWPYHKNWSRSTQWNHLNKFGSSWVPDAVYPCFKVICLLVPKKEIFEDIYHIWAWKPSWLCDPEHFNKFHPNIPWRLNRPSVFWGKEVWKCWIWATLGKGQRMTLTFDIHKGSCTNLVDCIYQLWYRLQHFLKKTLFYLFPIQKDKGPNLNLP